MTVPATAVLGIIVPKGGVMRGLICETRMPTGTEVLNLGTPLSVAVKITLYVRGVVGYTRDSLKRRSTGPL